MMDFHNIKFQGKFRSYQQTVLNNVEQHMTDNKIHIVAAPGSGKTVLGLELIHRLGSPALILSPTVTIRQQWGQRFTEGFLPSGENAGDYISFDLTAPLLLTSVTYQALHAAYNRIVSNEENELYEDGEQDFSGFNLIDVMQKSGINTVCLDEAHHLKSEWQKALEGFLDKLGGNVRIIALTATPPYDSTFQEWGRYISLCGDIDEEILVPQLVAQNNLCPHQDYIYFNYPAEEEIAVLKVWQSKSANVLGHILKDGWINRLVTVISLGDGNKYNIELLFEYPREFVALLCMAKQSGMNIPKKLVHMLCSDGKLPKFSWEQAETALQFVIDNSVIFGEAISKELQEFLAENGRVERRRVCLKSNDKINKLLVSSIGKLRSIQKITDSEYNSLGQSLRMLILTDHIRKDMLKVIGTDYPLDVMGTVPVFEVVRRVMPENVHIALLSGSLVILPDTILNEVENIAVKMSVPFKTKKLDNTWYSEVWFGSSNKHKVAIITEAYSQGLLHILVGTKSLLGEGWDSPGINVLILASFVGSFMLSNQMRGRAIRTDTANPSKTANIWHLITLEPSDVLAGTAVEKMTARLLTDYNKLCGNDYDTLLRRFDCFMGPAYNDNRIESGISRIDILKPPFDKAGIDRINKNMLKLSSDRQSMAARWENALAQSTTHDISDINEIPHTIKPYGFLYINALADLILSFGLIIIIQLTRGITTSATTFPMYLLAVAACITIGCCILAVTLRILRFRSPEQTVRTLANCLLAALQERGEIGSTGARVVVEADPIGSFVYVTLLKATIREKNIFAKAIREMLSAIDNPRYILIKRYRIFGIAHTSYSNSYACPAVIGTNIENVRTLVRHIKKKAGCFNIEYTRSETGRKILFKCRKSSYVNRNDILINGKRKMY